MDHQREAIRLEASGIPGGHTAAGLICPFCNGGRNSERSMSVTKRQDGTVLFLCHRASCGRSGRIDSSGYTYSEPRISQFKARHFQGSSRLLNEAERKVLKDVYDINDKELQWNRLTVDSNKEPRLLVPLFTRDGDVIGHISRLFPQVYYDITGWAPGLKTLTYKFKDAPCIGWCTSHQDQKYDSGILLVEDCISAIRGSRHLPTCFLCGSHLSLDMLMEVLKVTDNIILALDKDATDKAWAFKKKYSFIAPRLRVMTLDIDLKYMTDDTISKKLKEVVE